MYPLKKLKLAATAAFFAGGAAALLAFSDHNQISQLALLFTPEPEIVEILPPPEPTPVMQEAAAEAAVALDEFGFRKGVFEISEHRLKRRQTFTEILAPHGVSAKTISLLVEAAKPLFNVRSMRAGEIYRIYKENDAARFLVYQQDPIQYVVFDLQEPVRVYRGERPVTIVEKEVSGVINSSLYEALVEEDANPELAFRLAEVYAWEIDFYRIQPGDNFKVIYQERQVGGRTIGIGDVVAARFSHLGYDYYAFHFEQDDFGGYYDENGHSLRKVLLKSPLKYSVVTSGYTERRFHPVLKRYKAHRGTDYAAPAGTPILATGDGIVIEAGFKRNNGNYVKIRHNATYTTGYLHMSRIGEGIKRGARVQQGQVIGYVGSTGLATGDHVCYRFWKNGVQVDHREEVLPPSDPVEPAFRAAFEKRKAELMPRLVPATAPALAATEDESTEL